MLKSFPGDDKPHVQLHYGRALRQYAVEWDALGTYLGLEDPEIQIISKDNSNQTEDAFKAMLRIWLQKDAEATWSKLEEAITFVQIGGKVSNTSIMSGVSKSV